MKQHITVEQLNELSEKGKENLRKWWKIPSTDNMAIYYDERTDESLPLLLIGQMIEFLDEHCLETRQDWSIHFGKNFTLVGSSGNKSGKHEIKPKRNEELCDALWEAVKEILMTD